MLVMSNAVTHTGVVLLIVPRTVLFQLTSSPASSVCAVSYHV